jgi:hypothetical protein
MGLPKNYQDKEIDKFVEDANGNTAIRVVNAPTDSDGDDLEINPDGSAKTADEVTRQVLKGILVQLRIMNLHMELITDQKIVIKDN